jgi:hypothetical protein
MIKAKASGSKSVSKQDGGDGLFDMPSELPLLLEVCVYKYEDRYSVVG